METAQWDLGLWDHPVDIINFSKVSEACFGLSTVSQPKCVSVKGIIRLMESVWLGPKSIPISVFYSLNGVSKWD